MKQYLLLRDNNQSGPHSLEKLSSLELRPLDLIWIEDESTCWKNPEEIEELKPFVKHEVLASSNRIINQRIFVSFPENFSNGKSGVDNESPGFVPADPVKPLNEVNEFYKAGKQKKQVWNKRLFQPSHHTSIIVVFIGVVFGAFVVKKLVDGVVHETQVETAVASPIIDRPPQKPDDENFRNALVTEIVPVYKAPAKTKKPANVTKQLKLTTNNYKVGVFGGINGLRLSIFNTSSQYINRALITLDYLRPNGEVVQSENVLFKNIKPGKSQTISIPGSSRGVKVKYKILKVSSKEYKPDLKEI